MINNYYWDCRLLERDMQKKNKDNNKKSLCNINHK